jgi:hypothetical protein
MTTYQNDWPLDKKLCPWRLPREMPQCLRHFAFSC